MTRSMTAFSRQAKESDWGSLVWEIRSVNHRYLDVVIKMPDDLRSIENTVRQSINKHIKRGKIECHLRYKTEHQEAASLTINETVMNDVLKACQVISRKLNIDHDGSSEIQIIDVLKWPGVIIADNGDQKTITKAALGLLDDALNELLLAKQSEGQRLKKMLEDRCLLMKQLIADVRIRQPDILQKIREKIVKKIDALNIDHDIGRIEQELVFIAQKMDVEEELDRLDSHFIEIEHILISDKPVGRRLDFMMQELNREANTLGSKSADIDTTRTAVELKVLIEQMREQIQNIE